ncbi:LuxR family transcriptional regulator [Aureimonas sp. Leaf454]|uniref:response regulator transcription factor n=1 Tax=Aureimonas sp. Leaf454 TaxID=1736381 RepID=UPI0006F68613|nr:response regulator transcription factor [Aureimonas sp. Leaf454]KQT47505.1 LuxR family transcriptional regulator [Aureimonas sp. Leaf454]
MRVLVVDDHVIVREGVRRLLAVLPADAVYEAETPFEALAAFRRERPDVVVLDINLKGGSGLEVIRRLRADDPDARIVVFSMYSDLVYAHSAQRAGALGYVSKSAPSDELILAIRKAMKGEAHVDAETSGGDAAEAPAPARKLSTRELEILHMLGEGQSLSDIAEGLGVAYKTIANTSTRIKEKLGVERTSDLIRFAVETRGGRLIDRGDL